MSQLLRPLQTAVAKFEEIDRVVGEHGIEVGIENVDSGSYPSCMEIKRAAKKGRIRLEWGLFWNPLGIEHNTETAVFVNFFTDFADGEKPSLSPQVNVWYYPGGDFWDWDWDSVHRMPEGLTKLSERFVGGHINATDPQAFELISCLAAWFARLPEEGTDHT